MLKVLLMEELKAELAAKSCEINFGGQKHHLFYSWALYNEAKNHGVTIDANALADPERVIGEITKIIYVCILCYRSVAVKLGVPMPKSTPTLPEVEALMMLNPVEGRKAMEYVRHEMTDRIEEQREQKKRANESLPNLNVN